MHEQVLTDTARFADILLPATTVFEQTELHKSYGHYFLQYSDPVIPPVGESLSNPELFARLARAMGFEEPELAPSDDELLADALDGAGGTLRRRDAGAAAARDKLARVRFGERPRADPVRHRLPDDARAARSSCVRRSSARSRYTPPPTSRYPLTLLSPATRQDDQLDLRRVQPAERGAAHASGRRRGARHRDGDVVRVYNDLGEVHVPSRCATSCGRASSCCRRACGVRARSNGATATALAPDHLTDIGAGACFNDARVEVERVAQA